MKAWHDGTLVDEKEVLVSPLSHSFSRGTAIFEVLEVVESHRGSALFGLTEHIERLYRSSRLLRIRLESNITPQSLLDAVRETVRANSIRRGIVKLFVYYPAPEYSCVPADTRISIAIFCAEFPSDAQKDSFTACISSYRKNHPESVPVHAKAAGFYVNSFLALMEAAECGFDEAVLLDTMGYVAEGGTSNIFMIKDGMLMTPSLRSILPGITRQFILEIAAEFMECRETDIAVDQLLSADEVFFSNSVERIMPIRRIGDIELRESAPGTYTQKIMKTINDVIRGAHPAFARWLTPVE
jgi:branched-chain amino acid aminotransferase